MSVSFTGYRDGNGQMMQAMRVGHTGKTTVLQCGATATGVTVNSAIVRVCAHPLSASIVCTKDTAGLAATTDMMLPAGVVEYIVVDRSLTISCISATGGEGSFYLTEVI